MSTILVVLLALSKGNPTLKGFQSSQLGHPRVTELQSQLITLISSILVSVDPRDPSQLVQLVSPSRPWPEEEQEELTALQVSLAVYKPSIKKDSLCKNVVVSPVEPSQRNLSVIKALGLDQEANTAAHLKRG